MKKEKTNVDEFDEEWSAADYFVELLQHMIYDGVFNSYGFSRKSYCYQVTSASKVQKKIIGFYDDETKDHFLFPDLLLKRWKKETRWGSWPVVFFKKKELLKMLSREGFIIRAQDGSAIHNVSYHGMLVKAWKIDWVAFRKRGKDYYHY